jgi:hypothetical protein
MAKVENSESEGDGRPVWDQAQADQLLGASVIIGLTILTPSGALESQKQMHGTIQTVDSENGFEVALSGTHFGETYWLPPDLSAFQPAREGSYRLRSTGETIENPDFLTSWTIERPSP